MSKKRSGKSQKSQWEELFAAQIKERGLSAPVRQYPFAKSISRLYRADFAFLDEMLIIEINGGLFNFGRHARGAGVENDLERCALAAALGWKIMGFSPRQVKSGWGIEMTAVALGLREMDRSLANARRYK